MASLDRYGQTAPGSSRHAFRARLDRSLGIWSVSLGRRTDAARPPSHRILNHGRCIRQSGRCRPTPAATRSVAKPSCQPSLRLFVGHASPVLDRFLASLELLEHIQMVLDILQRRIGGQPTNHLSDGVVEKLHGVSVVPEPVIKQPAAGLRERSGSAAVQSRVDSSAGYATCSTISDQTPRWQADRHGRIRPLLSSPRAPDRGPPYHKPLQRPPLPRPRRGAGAATPGPIG